MHMNGSLYCWAWPWSLPTRGTYLKKRQRAVVVSVTIIGWLHTFVPLLLVMPPWDANYGEASKCNTKPYVCTLLIDRLGHVTQSTGPVSGSHALVVLNPLVSLKSCLTACSLRINVGRHTEKQTHTYKYTEQLLHPSLVHT